MAGKTAKEGSKKEEKSESAFERMREAKADEAAKKNKKK